MITDETPDGVYYGSENKISTNQHYEEKIDFYSKNECSA